MAESVQGSIRLLLKSGVTLIDPGPDIRTRPLPRMCHSQAWDVASTLAVSSFLGGGLLRVRLVALSPRPGALRYLFPALPGVDLPRELARELRAPKDCPPELPRSPSYFPV
jgi:hypothetical protein